MTRKFLEDKGLSKELIDEILDENSKDIGKAKGELETVKANLETAQKDNEGLKEQISKANTELESLKKSTDDADALRTQIENLQNQIKADGEKHDAEIKQIKIDSAIDNALVAANAKNAKAVKPFLDLTKVELNEDGTVKGIDEQIKALAKADDTKFLFASTKMKGASVGESGDDEDIDGVDTSKMTYSEMIAYLEANPDAKID